MKIIKPRFWQKKINIYSFLLLPITFIYIFLSLLKKNFTKKNEFKIPVICIGNIFIGGTGKTPLAIHIAKKLESLDKKPVIIRKFYHNQSDEKMLIKKNKINQIIAERRFTALKLAEKKFNVAIMDDGFQDASIKKDLNIICFNSNQLLGNGYIFPSGPLRESIKVINKAQLILINGRKSKIFEKKIREINKLARIFYSKYIPRNIARLKNSKVLAFAGIGNPENFFNMLKNSGIIIEKKLFFPDHYQFQKQELLRIVNFAKINNLKILTTEKDYLRIKKFKLKEIQFCSIELKIFDEKKLINEIKKIL